MAKRSKRKTIAGSGASTKVATASVSVQGKPSWFNRDWLWGLVLILSVILTYMPVSKAQFIYDDGEFLTANPCVVGPLGLKEIWTTSAADICPLLFTAFWAEHALWGLEPMPYHLVTVLLHGACAILLWQVLRSLRVQGAWLGAALWALHPVAVESVAWISEMKNTESGLFYLLSILFFVRWLRAKDLDGRTRGGWNYALTLLFAALGMASKSSTVILPVVLCLCAWWIQGRWHWRNLTSVVPVFLMAIAPCLVSIWIEKLRFATDTNPQWVRTWPERLVTAGDAVWFYLGKLLWPHPLMTIYPRWQIDSGQWLSYFALLAVIVILSIFWLERARWSRAFFFAFGYFVVALLPVLGFIDEFPFRLSFVFDHFQYLASMGPLALAGALLARFSNFIFPEKPWLRSSLCAGLLLILGMASSQRTLVYKSEETFWADTVTRNPDCWMGYNNLGNALFQKGQVDGALEQFQKALALFPNYVEAHSNLGAALFQKGQVDDAAAHYKRALEINPNHAQANYNLGLVLFEKGQVDDAIAHYRKAVKMSPYYPEAHNSLGNALLRKGELDEALEQFQKALEINPDYVDARSNLGATLFQKGQVDSAVAQYRKALEINPDYVNAHYNLGNALFQKGQLDEAIAQFQKAVEINPDCADAHYKLGNALYKRGQSDEAIDQFQKALGVNPNYVDAHSNLGVILFRKGQLDEAVAEFQKAVEISPNSFTIRYNLGSAFFTKGQLNEAITQFQEVLRLKPDFSPAQEILAKAQDLVRQREGHK
jgi:tetratricopeptide (TPR) repeat protein